MHWYTYSRNHSFHWYREDFSRKIEVLFINKPPNIKINNNVVVQKKESPDFDK